MNDYIWYKNPIQVFFSESTMFDVIPLRSMSLNEQMNALMRFAIYFSIIVFIIKKDFRIIYFPLFVALFTFVICYQNSQSSKDKKELLEKMSLMDDQKDKACMKPTKDNPFMNVNFVDYIEFANRPPACTDVDEEISREFEKGLYREEDDVFFKNASDRQFFTMPFTTIPNDQRSFAEWLFKLPPTLKESHIKN